MSSELAKLHGDIKPGHNHTVESAQAQQVWQAPTDTWLLSMSSQLQSMLIVQCGLYRKKTLAHTLVRAPHTTSVPKRRRRRRRTFEPTHGAENRAPLQKAKQVRIRILPPKVSSLRDSHPMDMQAPLPPGLPDQRDFQHVHRRVYQHKSRNESRASGIRARRAFAAIKQTGRMPATAK